MSLVSDLCHGGSAALNTFLFPCILCLLLSLHTPMRKGMVTMRSNTATSFINTPLTFATHILLSSLHVHSIASIMLLNLAGPSPVPSLFQSIRSVRPSVLQASCRVASHMFLLSPSTLSIQVWLGGWGRRAWEGAQQWW